MASLIAVAWMWVAAFRAYKGLPATIPIHFNFWGSPDSWGPRWMIFLLPVIAIFLLFLWSAIGIGTESMVSSAGVGRTGQKPLQPEQKVPFFILLFVMVGGFSYLNQKMVEIAGGRAAALSRSFLPVFLLAIGGTILWMLRAGSR